MEQKTSFLTLKYLKYPIGIILVLIFTYYAYVLLGKNTEIAQKEADMNLNVGLVDSKAKIEEKSLDKTLDSTTRKVAGYGPISNKSSQVSSTPSSQDRKLPLNGTESVGRKSGLTINEYPQRQRRPAALYYGQNVTDEPIQAPVDHAAVERVRKAEEQATQREKQLQEQIENLKKEKLAYMRQERINYNKTNPQRFKVEGSNPYVVGSDEQPMLFLPLSGSSNNTTNGFYSGNERNERSRNTNLKQSMNQSNSVQNNGTDRSSGQPLLKGQLVENKTVTDGQSVKILISEDRFGFQTGETVTGICRIQGDRLMINVDGKITNGKYESLNYTVFDVDGHMGLQININADDLQKRQMLMQSASSTMSQVNPLMIMNPSGNLGTQVTAQIGAQLAGSVVNQGLNTARQLIQNRVQTQKAIIKTGQILYLFPSQNRVR